MNSTAGPTRILVVDDHRLSRRYAVAALRSTRCLVKQARTGRQAIAIALGWLPELILLDRELPDLHGIEVARRIRAAWPGPGCAPRIVLMTAGSLRHGEPLTAAVDLLEYKPICPDRLRDLTGLALERNAQCTRIAQDALPEMFRRELRSQLDALDTKLATVDLDGARRILHQLIAASAICREPRLENHLRRLHRACRELAPRPLARAYVDVLRGAHRCLYRNSAWRSADPDSASRP